MWASQVAQSRQSACQFRRCKRCGFELWIRKIFLVVGRKWQPTPVFFPGKFHGQRSVMDYSPWDCTVRHD